MEKYYDFGYNIQLLEVLQVGDVIKIEGGEIYTIERKHSWGVDIIKEGDSMSFHYISIYNYRGMEDIIDIISSQDSRKKFRTLKTLCELSK
jgi:hypothetical protein